MVFRPSVNLAVYYIINFGFGVLGTGIYLSCAYIHTQHEFFPIVSSASDEVRANRMRALRAMPGSG